MGIQFKLLSSPTRYFNRCFSLNVFWLVEDRIPDLYHDRAILDTLHNLYIASLSVHHHNTDSFLPNFILKTYSFIEKKTSPLKIKSSTEIARFCKSILLLSKKEQEIRKYLVILKGDSRTKNHLFSLQYDYRSETPFSFNELFSNPIAFKTISFSKIDCLFQDLQSYYQLKTSQQDARYVEIQGVLVDPK